MTSLRDLWADLRDRRLLPVAVLLLVVLVAIPVVLGGSGAPAVESTPAGPPLPAAASSPAQDPSRVVRLKTPSTAGAAAHGRPRDPFGSFGAVQPDGSDTTKTAPVQATPSTATPSTAATPTPATTPTPAPTPAAPTTTPTTTVDTAPAKSDAGAVRAGYRTDVSFGQAGATSSLRDVIRLRPLRTVGGPLAVFLGVRPDRMVAVFLLAPGVTPTGDGRCLPTAQDCQTLELGRNGSEFFDVPHGDAGVTQYELDVDRLVVRRADTRSAALRLTKRESAAGRKLMHSLYSDGQIWRDHYKYFPGLGALLTRPVVLTPGQ